MKKEISIDEALKTLGLELIPAADGILLRHGDIDLFVHTDKSFDDMQGDWMSSYPGKDTVCTVKMKNYGINTSVYRHEEPSEDETLLTQ